ncbi:MAG: hypothetical protein ABI810_02900 [Sphingomonas bacterium]
MPSSLASSTVRPSIGAEKSKARSPLSYNVRWLPIIACAVMKVNATMLPERIAVLSPGNAGIGWSLRITPSKQPKPNQASTIA